MELNYPSISPVGYFILYGEKLGKHQPLWNHRFCGSHNIKNAICPNCKKELLLMLSIDTNDSRVNLKEVGFSNVPLLFCWTCPIATEEYFYYRIENENSIQILGFAMGQREEDFPYPNYPHFFPESRCELTEIPERIHRRIIVRNKLMILDRRMCNALYESVESLYPWHQIGGEAPLYELVVMNCPNCMCQMRFLATIADDNLDPRGFTDNCGVQTVFYICKKCRVIGARQECD